MKLPKPSIVPLKPSRARLDVLNQVKLPHVVEWVACYDARSTAASIKDMHVRGAPAIGIAAAYGFYLGVWRHLSEGKAVNKTLFDRLKATLDRSRPTAVNLFWATERLHSKAMELIGTEKNSRDVNLALALYEEAVTIHEDDARRCHDMGEHTLKYLLKKARPKQKGRKLQIMTHCNSGALATGGIGTALGAIRLAGWKGLLKNVFVNETRPYLQGSRLTAFELQKEKIPATLVVDSMAGYLMQKKMVDVVIVGSDRFTRRGDVANKIGTYSLSVLAKEHRVPFIVVAPLSTYDDKLERGSQIEVEERTAREVTHIGEAHIAARIKVLNYSFDITPNENISAIITEKGIFKPDSRC